MAIFMAIWKVLIKNHMYTYNTYMYVWHKTNILYMSFNFADSYQYYELGLYRSLLRILSFPIIKRFRFNIASAILLMDINFSKEKKKDSFPFSPEIIWNKWKVQ